MPDVAEVATEKPAPSEAVWRTLKGRTGRLFFYIAILFCLFQLYTAWATPFPNLQQRAVHLAFALVVCFALFPFRKRSPMDTVPWYDYILMGLGVIACAWIVIFYYEIMEEAGMYRNQGDLILGVVATLLVLEGARRTIGTLFPSIAVVAILYTLLGQVVPGTWGHGGFSPIHIIESIYLGTLGMWGFVTHISATIIASYIIFGSLILFTGGGQTFLDFAVMLAGRAHGGPAKVAVIGSAMFGTISGSAVANVATTGSFTIPMMKRLGYPAHLAGAVEATASTGGMIMPPIMGAGAFVMAELLEIAYVKIAIAAAIPAILYFWGAGAAIHFEAQRIGLRKVPPEEIPKARQVLAPHRSLPLFVPLALLLFFLGVGFTPGAAAFWAIFGAFIVYWLMGVPSFRLIFHPRQGLPVVVPLAALAYFVVARVYKPLNPGLGAEVLAVGVALSLVALHLLTRWAGLEETQRRLRATVAALASAGRGIVMVAVLLVTANIVVVMIALSGIGPKISEAIISLSGGIAILALFFAMVVAIILGMGLPPVASYILAVSVVGPALQKLGVPELPAHMFVFYFSIIAAITPPVCAAVYVAAGIAAANWLKVGWLAVRFGLPGFIVPYMFVYAPVMLLGYGENPPLEVAWATISAIVGVTALAAGSMGFLIKPAHLLQRVVLIGAALMLITPGALTDLAGFALLAMVYLWQRFAQRERAPKVAVAE